MKRLAAPLAAATVALAGCAGVAPGAAPAPPCSAVERLGLVAQSVPASSYVPCIAGLAAGWRSDDFRVRDGGTSFALVSDRAAGHPARVEFRPACRPSGAPVPARTVGGRTYLELRTLSPRFAGTMYDVFPGGCVAYSFDFERGPHIALMAELQAAVGFVPRAELARRLRDRLGVELP